MNKNSLVIFAAIAVLAGGIWFLIFGNNNADESAGNDIKKQTGAQEEKTEVKNNYSNADLKSSAAPKLDPNYQKIMNATIKTSLGEIKIELNGDKTPITAGNFAKLAENGFYDGVKFHRVISGFMIQGGDPLTKDDAQKQLWGTGGPGYKFNDEAFEGQYTRGTIAMANSGANTNGSQFFIMHQDYPLPPSYVIFGKVLEGMEAVDAIAALETDSRDCPLDPPVIENIIVNG